MKKMTISDILFIAVVSSAMGVFWWGYTMVNDYLQPLVAPWGLKHLFEGIWLMGALFFPYIIRKPGSALLGEMVAASVQGLIAKWGVTSLIYGFVQALPVEIMFLIMKYKKWSMKSMILGGIISAAASFVLTYFIYKYEKFESVFNLVQLLSFLVSGAVLGGVFSKWLADLLKQSGVLNQFKIVSDEIK